MIPPEPPTQPPSLQAEWPDRPAGTPPKKKGPARFLKELPVLILIAFGLALLIKTFLIQAFYIPSASMEPTLHGCDGCSGDRVLVNKLVYRFRDPRRGEIVVFVAAHGEHKSFFGKIVGFLTEGLGAARGADTDYIKRVIGLPGETVEMRDAVVTVTQLDGTRLKLSEPYLAKIKDLRPFGPFSVPRDSYFVMGDNRPESSDSRFSLGPVKRSDIVGKAFVKVWPPGRAGLLRLPRYGSSSAALGGVVAIGLWRRRRRRRSLPARRAA